MRISRRILPAFAAGALALSLASCGAESERGGGGSTLTFGAAGAPSTFDPFYATDGETFRISRQIFDTLIDTKPGTSEIEPGLAESWEPDATGTKWTFKLRDGVTFTDGEPFDGEAVCANLERMYDQNPDGQTAGEYWGSFFGGFKNDAEKDPSLYKGCEAPDETTAVISIDHATASFPTLLSQTSFSMQSPKAMEEGDANGIKAAGEGFTFPENAKNPVGTGAFKLEKYDEANGTVTLVRNDDYWDEPAKSEKLVFRIIPDESTRRQELEAGSINGYDLPNPVDWNSLEEQGNQVEIRDPFNILYLGLNLKDKKFHDLKVRQAIYHALNRDELVKSQLPEGATVATQFMPDTVAGYNKDLEPYAYDPEKSKQLLKEAGAEGLEMTFAFPTEVSRPYMPDPATIYDALRANLEAVGITVKAVSAPWTAYTDNVSAGKYDAHILGWTGDFNDAYNFLGSFFTEPVANDFKTSNISWGKKLADDLKAADAIVDEAERAKRYEEINEQIMTEYLPGFPISHSPPAIVVDADTEGLVPSPLTAEDFAPVSVGGE